MSSDVLGTLAVLRRRVERAHGRLAVFGLDPTLREMTRICGLEPVLEIYPTEGEALRARRPVSDEGAD
jgi:anti-anti-sigma factor